MEEAGVKLIAEGAAAYLGDLRSAENATNSFVDSTEKGSGRINAASEVIIGGLRRVGAFAVEAFGQALQASAAFVGDSVTLAGEFDQTMSVLQETSNATDAELQQLRAAAKDLGSDLTLPATSAVDAGDAMLELAKAGFTARESMDAAKGVLQLAAAAQIEEAKAAEINANALMAFNLEAKDSIFVSDLLAASANASSIDATDMADTYKMAGAVFSAFQGPVVGSKEALIDLTTAASMLGNAGIKGSDAGTALKQSLLQLTGPSQKAKDEMRALYLATLAEGDAGQNLSLVLQGNAKERMLGLQGLSESAGATAELGDIAYDAAGNMRPFREILELTAAATATMSQEQRNAAITSIFGADAARAILVLMQQGPEAWDKMTVAVTEQGAAQQLAEAQTKGFKGALEGAKSQLETLQLTIGEALTPALADLFNNYVSPGIATLNDLAGAIFGDVDAFGRLSPELQSVVGFVQGVTDSVNDIIASFEDAGAGSIEFAESIGGLADTLGLPGDLIQDLVRGVQDVVSWFDQGGAASSDLGGAVDDLSSIWQKAGQVVANVLGGYQDIIDSVLPQVQQFIGEHGDEIQAFFQEAWDSIVEIINLALDLYNEIVPPALHAVADWIDEHSTGIQAVLSGAWDVISGVVTGALALVKGVIETTLALIRGDWEGAWTAIQDMSVDFTLALGQTIEGFLNIIAGFFDTSLDEIATLWENNWNQLVDIATQTDWAQVGRDVVDGIIAGLAGAWSSLVGWISDRVSGLVDAALDAIDAGSPAKEWMPVGQFSVQGIMQGFSDQWPALTKLVEKLGDDLVEQAQDLGQAVQNAISDSFSSTASIDRQIAKNLDSLADDVLPDYQQFTAGALKQAENEARAFLDPTEGARFFQLRSKQILEYAKLQQQLADEEDDAARERLKQQMLLINAAQTAELNAFNANLNASQSGVESLMDSIQAFLMTQGEDGKNALPGVLESDVIRQITGWMSQLSQMAAANPYLQAYANPAPATYNQRTYNMPIYTNQTPAALQSSMAIMGSMYP